MPPKGIQYFSIDDQIIEEMKAEGLIEERRPTEVPVEVVAEDPHARFDERAGLLNSKRRRADGREGRARGGSPTTTSAARGVPCTRCALKPTTTPSTRSSTQPLKKR